MKFVDLEKFDIIGWEGIPTGYRDTFADGVMWLLEMLDASSAAKVKPHRDKWIAVHGAIPPDGGTYYECPYCGKYSAVGYGDPMPEKCWNCEAELKFVLD